MKGLELRGNPDHRFKFNGKERTEVFGLNMDDFGWRHYDPARGRWDGIDNLSEKYISLSNYHYAGNNPLRYIDLDGNVFTESAWKYVNRLLGEVDRRQERNNTKIVGKTEKLAAGEGKANKLKRQISRLQQENQDLETFKGGIETLSASDQIYNISLTNAYNQSGNSVGGASFDFSTGIFEVGLPSNASNSLIAHELQHAYQFEKGQYSIGYELPKEAPYQNFLYDKHDELQAYNQWGALFGGQTYNNINLLPALYKDIATGPVDITTHPNTSLLSTTRGDKEKIKRHFQRTADRKKAAFRFNNTTYYYGKK